MPLFCTAAHFVSCSNMAQNPDTLVPLYILSILPYQQVGSTQPRLGIGRDLLPAIELAVKHVNCRRDLLPGYKLVLINSDGGCDVSHRGVRSYVEQVLYNGRGMYDRECSRESWNMASLCRTFAGIIGPACVESVTAISSLINRESRRLVNIHLIDSPILQDRTVFPHSFGILGSSLDMAEAVLTLIRRNGWTKISVLYEQDTGKTFQETANYLKERLHVDASLGDLEFVSQITDNFLPIRNVSISSRIIVILANTAITKKVMCLASEVKMIYPKHQWILIGSNLYELNDSNVRFTYNDMPYDCSRQQLVDKILSKSLLLKYNFTGASHWKTDVGRNYAQFRKEYVEQIQLLSQTSNYTLQERPFESALVYDAVWVLAYSFNATLVHHQQGITSPNISSDARYYPLNTNSIQGVSGLINFNSHTGYNQRVIDIFQVFDGRELFIGQYYGNSATIFNASQVYFLPNSLSILAVRWELSTFFTLVTLILLVFSICLHALCIVYWNYHSIKASNPKLHQLIFLGCYILILNEMVYIWPLKTIRYLSFGKEGPFCHATLAWLPPIGWTLIFASLIAHAWRLYRIFIHYTKPGRYISDWALGALILFQLSIDLLLAAVWTIVDPTLSRPVDSGKVDSEGKPILTAMCYRKFQYLWIPLMFSYKLFQLFILFVLSVLTRNIKTNNFETNKYRIASYLICLVFVVLSMALALLYFKNAEIHSDFTVYCVLVTSILCLCYGFILFPPVLPLLKEKLSRKETINPQRARSCSIVIL